jgi:tetratricopeptide (TPR) repeat protein
LARCLKEDGQYNEALATAMPLVANDATESDWNLIALIYSHLERFEDACSASQVAVAMDPDNDVTRRIFARSLYRLERYAEAEFEFERARRRAVEVRTAVRPTPSQVDEVRKNPMSGEVWSALAKYAEASKDSHVFFDEAERVVGSSVVPVTAWVGSLRQMLRLAPSRTEVFLSQLLETNDKNADLLYLRALAMKHGGRLGEAAEAIVVALTLRENEVQWWFVAGRIFEGAHSLERAENAYRHCLKLAPRHQRAAECLDQLLSR